MGLTANSPATITITLNSLAAGNASAGDKVDNTANGYSQALISASIFTGTQPTAGTTYDYFLIRGDNLGLNTNYSDNWGGNSMYGTFVRTNAPHLGSIKVTASADTIFSRYFNTWKLGHLGPWWSIAVLNSTNQTSNANGSGFVVRYFYGTPDRVATPP